MNCYKATVTIVSEPDGLWRVVVLRYRQAEDPGLFDAYQHLTLNEAIDVASSALEGAFDWEQLSLF